MPKSTRAPHLCDCILQVYEGIRQVKNISGIINSPVTYVSSENTMDVYFHSDSSGTDRGIRASYKEGY